MARQDPQINFRIPAVLRQRLNEAVTASGRSLTSEIVHRLEESFTLPEAHSNVERSFKTLLASHHRAMQIVDSQGRVIEQLAIHAGRLGQDARDVHRSDELTNAFADMVTQAREASLAVQKLLDELDASSKDGPD